jgi:formate C-acetyltransferase
VHDCVERGTDIAQGGGRYNYTYTQLVGFPTLVDSLEVIKTLVYEKKSLSLRTLSDALRANWSGHEALRKYISAKLPKWGNDIREIDELGREVLEFYFQSVLKHKGIHQNGGFYPGFLCFVMHDVFGSQLGATPDGRFAGRPVSNSIGPVSGQGKAGLTATCNSAAKIDHSRIGGASSVLNLTVLKSNLDTPGAEQSFIALIKGYFKKGGFQVQVNMVDKAKLLEAQADPGKYLDLQVKVGGFSACFVDLNRNLQDEIIARFG